MHGTTTKRILTVERKVRENMKKYIVDYKSGDSRTNPGVSVDYMLVKVDGVELYAEAIAQDDESANYDELKASIIEQANKQGICADTLIFWYDIG